MPETEKDEKRKVRFSQLTESRLRKAGWFPGRRTDLKPSLDKLQAAGFEVNEPAMGFLAEFGVLNVTDDDRTELPSRAREWFDRIKRRILDERNPIHILLDIHVDAVVLETEALDLKEFYDVVAGSALCPVAYARFMQESILVDRRGAVFSGWCGQHISFIGASLDKAVDWIVGRNPDNDFPQKALALLHPSGIEYFNRYEPPQSG